MRILKPWRLLTRTLALSAMFDVGVATAQTVVVRGAPAGAPIEVRVEGTAKTANADSSGVATFSVGVAGGGGDAAVQVFVDRCGDAVRVQIIRRGVPLPTPDPGCARGEIWGAFLMQPVTTFLVEVDTPNGAVHVRQGPAPRSWVSGEQEHGTRVTFETPPPAGLMVWAGAGISHDGDAINTLCGNVTGCSGDNYTGALAVGATYWIKRVFGAQVAYGKRAQARAKGSGTQYSFDSTVDTDIFTISGVAGISAGAYRIYGEGGANYHRATFSTNETTEDMNVTVDNVPQTIKGGTQTLNYTTEGWGWQAGAGLEAWATRFIAIYVDGVYSKLQGSDVTGGEAHIDEPMFMITAGVRVRIGR
jgi:hypothetical protein